MGFFSKEETKVDYELSAIKPTVPKVIASFEIAYSGSNCPRQEVDDYINKRIDLVSKELNIDKATIQINNMGKSTDTERKIMQDGTLTIYEDMILQTKIIIALYINVPMGEYNAY